MTVLVTAALSVSAKRLVVFGDSISDNGNGKRLTTVHAIKLLHFIVAGGCYNLTPTMQAPICWSKPDLSN